MALVFSRCALASSMVGFLGLFSAEEEVVVAMAFVDVR